VSVEFPAPPDGDPAFWSPDAADIAAYQGADLILLNGAGYAKWTERVSLPLSKVVNTSEGIADRYLVVDDAVTHSHGPGGEHSHGETAFTTWLDPTLATEQAAAILEALAAVLPDERVWLEARYDSLAEDLAALDRRMTEIVGRKHELPLVASHPVYQYLARRYELNLRSVHFEPDEMPDAAGWATLAALREEHPADWMLWEGEPLPETAAKLAAMGVRSVVFDPCGNRPESGDYLSVMGQNLANLEVMFSSTGP
jgi:zinc transport system substrate-binding protein